MEVRIRDAVREDCGSIMVLRKQLPTKQNVEQMKMLSVEELQRDGFDVPRPFYKCLVAEMTHSDGSNQIVGYALWFYSYAAFEGKSMHLEDLCVSSEIRNLGVGSKLMKSLAKICLAENLARITLEVLDWNEPAIKFYEKNYGKNSTVQDHWVAYLIEGEALSKLAG